MIPKSAYRVLLGSFGVFLAIAVMNPSRLAGQASKKTTDSGSTKGSAASDAKVDLNTASEKDLENLPGVGAATAKKIIAGRPYSSMDDLSKAGVSAATVKKITPLAMVGGGRAAAATTKAAPAAAPPAAAPSAPAAASKPAPMSPAKMTSAPVSQGSAGPGMVWVNLDSGVYHYSNSRYYGKTKSGKYLSEADAIKAGYHASKDEKKPQ